MYFRLQVTYKSYRHVLTPITNFQLLLKLEILDKLRLVTSHKNTTQRKQNILAGSISTGETGVLMTLNQRASMLQRSLLKRADVFSFDATQALAFAVVLRYSADIT